MERTRKLRAADIVLLAAYDLFRKGFPDFNEWDLTVATWERDKKRFGMRGMESMYPDHKRVSMEYMGQKTTGLIFRKLLFKSKPNWYRLTPEGVREAVALVKPFEVQKEILAFVPR